MELGVVISSCEVELDSPYHVQAEGCYSFTGLVLLPASLYISTMINLYKVLSSLGQVLLDCRDNST